MSTLTCTIFNNGYKICKPWYPWHPQCTPPVSTYYMYLDGPVAGLVGPEVGLDGAGGLEGAPVGLEEGAGGLDGLTPA